MEPHIKKYDGWTRLGPGKRDTVTHHASSIDRVQQMPSSKPVSNTSIEESERHIKEMIAALSKMSNPSAVGNLAQEINMTQTGFLTSKAGKRFIRVDFSRPRGKGIDTAEGILPGGRILKQNGFTEKEIESLEQYLKKNKEEIVKRAKELSNPLHWFK